MPPTFTWEETPDGRHLDMRITMLEDGACRIQNLMDKSQSFETSSPDETRKALSDLLAIQE